MNASSTNSSSLYDRYPTPVDLYNRFAPDILLLDRITTPIWYCLGLFGNSLSSYVWLRPDVRRNNSSAVYLAALSLYDLFFLVLHTLQELREAWNVTLEHMIICSLMPVVLLTAQYLSPLLVLAFTVERWVSICFPFRRQSLCTPRRACCVVAALTAFVTAWNLWQVYFKQFRGGTCKRRQAGWFAYTLATEVAISGIVPVTALVFNLLVIRELYKIAKGSKTARPSVGSVPDVGDERVERRFRSTTMMLLCVSFFVILTSLPAGLMYGLQEFAYFGSANLNEEEVLRDPTWRRHFAMTRAKKVIDEVSLSHYSLNFLIYLATGPQYRRHAMLLMRRAISGVRGLVTCVGADSDGDTLAVGGAGSRKRHLQKQREAFYLNNSSTSRSKRTSSRTPIEDAAGADVASAKLLVESTSV